MFSRVSRSRFDGASNHGCAACRVTVIGAADGHAASAGTDSVQLDGYDEPPRALFARCQGGGCPRAATGRRAAAAAAAPRVQHGARDGGRKAAVDLRPGEAGTSAGAAHALGPAGVRDARRADAPLQDLAAQAQQAREPDRRRHAHRLGHSADGLQREARRQEGPRPAARGPRRRPARQGAPPRATRRRGGVGGQGIRRETARVQGPVENGHTRAPLLAHLRAPARGQDAGAARAGAGPESAQARQGPGIHARGRSPAQRAAHVDVVEQYIIIPAMTVRKKARPEPCRR